VAKIVLAPEVLQISVLRPLTCQHGEGPRNSCRLLHGSNTLCYQVYLVTVCRKRLNLSWKESWNIINYYNL